MNILTQIAKILVAGGLITWMVQKGLLDFSVLKKLAEFESLAICFSLVFFIIFNNNFRWILLLKARNIQVSIKETLPLSFIGVFFNYAMPGGVGGDVVKGYYLLKDFPEKKVDGAMSILMDRVLGMFAMLVMAMAVILFDLSRVLAKPELKVLALGVTLMTLAFCLTFAFSLSRRIYSKGFFQRIFEKLPGGGSLQKVYSAFHEYGHKKKTVFIAIGMSFFSHLSIVTLCWFVVETTGMVSLPLSTYLIAVPLGMIATTLPIAPAGIGVGQAAFYFLFKAYSGVDSQAGPNAITVYQVVLLCWGFVGAYFYLMRKNQLPQISESLNH